MGDWSVVPEAAASNGEFSVVQPAKPGPVSQGQSAVRGALQGASLGFGDEIAAAIDSAVSHLPGVRYVAQKLQDPKLPPVADPNVTYAQRRDAYRNANHEAQIANPLTYAAGQVAGGIAAPIPGGPASTLLGTVARGAATGAVAGAGGSEGGDWQSVLGDTLKGAGIGGATAGVLGGIGKGIRINTTVTPGQQQAVEALQRIAETGTPAQKTAALAGLKQLADSGVITQELGGPVVEGVKALAKPLTHGGPIAGLAGAVTGHLSPLQAGLTMAAPLVPKIADKGAELLINTVNAAKAGNVAAQKIIQGLTATPEGAARVASVLGSQ